MAHLWELTSAIDGIKEAIEHASRLAYDLSGADGGVQGGEYIERLNCPDCNGSGFGCVACNSRGYFDVTNTIPEIPAVEGWPAMLAVVDRLGYISLHVDNVLSDEVKAAIAAENDQDDRYG
jgi:hypothetical protein